VKLAISTHQPEQQWIRVGQSAEQQLELGAAGRRQKACGPSAVRSYRSLDCLIGRNPASIAICSDTLQLLVDFAARGH
jgi:hypothetical protein